MSKHLLLLVAILFVCPVAANAEPPGDEGGWPRLARLWRRYAESEAKDEAARAELLKGGEASLEVLFDLLFGPRPDPKVDALVEKLGSDKFEVREAATKELRALGGAALPQLERHLSDPDAEIRA